MGRERRSTEHMIPDAHVTGKFSAPIMTTADLSLRHDPFMEPIARRFHNDQQPFADAFSGAWFKLTHRDLGPRALYLGPDVPTEILIWQDPSQQWITHSLTPMRSRH